MATKTKATRKKLIYSTAAFIASTAISAVPANAWTDEEARGAFESSDEFTYCDIRRILVDQGHGSIDTVKIRIGESILDGSTSYLKNKSKRAAEFHRYDSDVQCTLEDGNYSYEDAQDLARFWGMSNDDAEKRIVKWIGDGNNKKIRKNLKQARN